MVFFFLANGRIDAHDTTTDPFFGFGPIAFAVLRQLYILAIVCIFVSSLGNRPQGSKWIYISCMLLFILIMCVGLYLTGFTVYLVLTDTIRDLKPGQSLANVIFTVPVFRDLVNYFFCFFFNFS